MRTLTPATAPRHERVLSAIPPALVAAAVVFLFGWMGPMNPLAWVLAGPAVVLGFVLVLRTAPLILFWSVPISMYWFVYLPVMHYEVLALVAAAVTGAQSLARMRLRRLRIPVLEGRFLLFLLAILPGLLVATNLWRYFGSFKIYVVGLLGFEAARRGARRLGHEALLWGPAVFLGISAAMLTLRVMTSGIPSFKGIALRSYLSSLPWGSSNYVAAVMVLGLPALVLLARTSPRGGMRRTIATGIIVLTLASMLFTTSRGGFLLAMLYLIVIGTGARRSLGTLALATLALVVALVATPFGQALLSRFVDARSWDSVYFRVMIWQAALERGLSHLPFGVGAGQGLLQDDKLQGLDPHNYLLHLFGELGPLGLALWLMLLARVWSDARLMWKDERTRTIGGACLGTLSLAFFNMLFEPTLSGNLYHLLFWWILGIYYGGAERANARAAIAVP